MKKSSVNKEGIAHIEQIDGRTLTVQGEGASDSLLLRRKVGTLPAVSTTGTPRRKKSSTSGASHGRRTTVPPTIQSG